MNCTKCDSNFAMYYGLTDNGVYLANGECVKCKVLNCFECSKNLIENCTKCMSGY